MIAYEEALMVARQHIADLPPLEDCRWVLREGKRVAVGWYFDYTFEPLPGKEEPMIGGAPGFIVEDGRRVRVVHWDELRSLKVYDDEKA